MIEVSKEYETTPLQLANSNYTFEIYPISFFFEMNNFYDTIEVSIFDDGVRIVHRFIVEGTYHYKIDEEKGLAIDFKSRDEIYLYRIDF